MAVSEHNEGPHSSLADPQVAEPATHSVLMRLREMIVSGEIAPDTRLRAEALAEQLEVSRTPVRSAMAVLSAEGLVSYSVNRGYTVRAVTMGNVLDSIEVRASLESIGCRLAVERGLDDAELRFIVDAVEEARAIVDKGKWSADIERHWYKLNWMFHRAIQMASRNPVLRNALRMTLVYPVLGDVVRVWPGVAAHMPPRERQLPSTTPPHIETSQTAHEAILAAMQKGDADAAARLMKEHVLATKQRLRRLATFS